MTTTEHHYDSHLGPIYSWMVGDIDAALAGSATELDALALPNRLHATAIDLGAGFGLHALPLAQRGYHVTAIDSCEQLLNELRQRRAELPIKIVKADLLAFPEFVPQPADVILCMGDTLTHLPDFASVESLFAAVARSLNAGGTFVTTFRDYVSAPLRGEHRFIPVRSDANRILTCFLEYFADRVTIHDLLNQRDNDKWTQRVSSYSKLRLAPDWVVSNLTELGLAVRTRPGRNGMVCVTATSP